MYLSLPNYKNLATHQSHEQEINKVREVNLENQENNIEMVNRDVGNSLGSNKRPRKKESKVWEEMKRYTGEDGNVFAKCIHCEKKFDGSSKKGTTHLNNHLMRCRQRKRDGGGDADKSMKTTSDLTSQLVVNQEESVMDLIKNISNYEEYHGLWWDPLVCSTRMLRTINSRKVDILRVYQEEKEKLYKFLCGLSCRFSLEIRFYYGWYILTVHYIDDSWKHKSNVIGMLKAFGNDLMATLKELCLDLKIDGKMCSIFYDRIEDDDIIGEIDSWFSQRCSLPFGGHMFAGRNLFDDISHPSCNMRDELINWLCESHIGIDRCVHYVNETASNKHKFQTAVDKVKSMGKKVMTSTDLPLFYFGFPDFEIAVGYKEAFCELERIDPDFKSLNLTKEQWDDATVAYEHAKQLFDGFESLASLSELPQSNYSTWNTYFPKFCDVYTKLLPRERIEGYHLSKNTLPQAYKRRKFIDSYWSKINLVLVIAAILDPRFKMGIVQLWYNKIYGNYADRYLKKINDDFINVYNEYAVCGDEATSPISYLDEMGRPRTCASSSSGNVSSKSELDRYLNQDPKCPPYEKLDILAWWRANAEIYPTLARIARDFLVGPINPLNWRVDKIIILGKNVHDDIIPALVCLINWLKTTCE